MSSWADDRYCIACGEENPIGMHLRFTLKEESIEAKYTFPKEFQGYKNTVHGGMISLLLDEIMVNLPWRKYKVPVVSADIRVKLRKPLKVGESVICSAHFIKQKKKVFIVKGELKREIDNELIAESEAVCVKIDMKNV